MSKSKTPRKSLQWHEQANGSWWAYSGRLFVGMVIKFTDPANHPAPYQWRFEIPFQGRPGLGYRKHRNDAKRAIEERWAAWLDFACLITAAP